MPGYSKSSSAKLETCHPDLVLVFKVVVKYFDNTITCGGRTPEKQFQLFKQGRELLKGQWVKVGKTVTNCDGYKKISRHNIKPLSEAVDAVAYPIDYTNVRRQIYFAGYVLGVARILKRANKIKNLIVWGADWDRDTHIKDTRFKDFPHFQIKKP